MKNPAARIRERARLEKNRNWQLAIGNQPRLGPKAKTRVKRHEVRQWRTIQNQSLARFFKNRAGISASPQGIENSANVCRRWRILISAHRLHLSLRSKPLDKLCPSRGSSAPAAAWLVAWSDSPRKFALL